MEQRELGKKGNDGADQVILVLVMHLSDPGELVAESRQFQSITLDWYRARGAAASGVQLLAVSDPRYHNAIKDLFGGLHAMEISLRSVFSTASFRLALHDQTGNVMQEYDFPPGKKIKRGVLELLLSKLKHI